MDLSTPAIPAIRDLPQPGGARVPVAVVMISLNEEHNMRAVLENVSGWAQEIFLVDSYSSDATIDVALAYGVRVVQRPFRGFGDQWNFAVRKLPITAPWTMKLDPDERITPELKEAIREAVADGCADGFVVRRRLWFMGRPLPVRQQILRLWRTGTCRFSDVAVNEQPLIEGTTRTLAGELEHHDSPTLHHWYEKQNRYSTAEAIGAYSGNNLSAAPRLFGSRLERRMWVKKIYSRLPLRHLLVRLYCILALGAWRGGRAGWIWARMRAEVYRMREYKLLEMQWHGRVFTMPPTQRGVPDPRIPQMEDQLSP